MTQTATVTPIRPAATQATATPEAPEMIGVNVGYGPSAQEFQVKPGSTVADVIDNAYIKEVIGFSGGKGESVTVNGQPSARDRVLNPADRVEVIKRAGEKA